MRRKILSFFPARKNYLYKDFIFVRREILSFLPVRREILSFREEKFYLSCLWEEKFYLCKKRNFIFPPSQRKFIKRKKLSFLPAKREFLTFLPAGKAIFVFARIIFFFPSWKKINFIKLFFSVCKERDFISPPCKKKALTMESTCLVLLRFSLLVKISNHLLPSFFNFLCWDNF